MAAHKTDPREMSKLEAPQRVGRMPPETVIELLDPHPGVRCLDLGAGTGYVARPLASHLAPGGVVALDRSSALLRDLGRRAREAGVWVARVQADAGRLPFREGAFGRVLSLNLHHELDDPAPVMAEARRVLGEDGRVVVVDWAPVESPSGPPLEHRRSEEGVVAGLREAAFGGVETHDLLDHHWVVVARPGKQ